MDRWPLLVPGALGVAYLFWQFAIRLPGLRAPSSNFNSTDAWTPEPREGQEPVPRDRNTYEWAQQLLPPRLNDGERLVGFALAQFFPPRRENWGYQRTVPRYQTLIATTEERMLLLDLSNFPRVVRRSWSVEFQHLESLHPPKRGLFGTSGRLRFRTDSGAEYDFELNNPILFPNYLRHEHALADHLRRLAIQLPYRESTEHRRALAG